LDKKRQALHKKGELCFYKKYNPKYCKNKIKFQENNMTFVKYSKVKAVHEGFALPIKTTKKLHNGVVSTQ